MYGLITLLGKPFLALALVLSLAYLCYFRGEESVRKEWITSDHQRELKLSQEKAIVTQKQTELNTTVRELNNDIEDKLKQIETLSVINQRLVAKRGLFDKHKAPSGVPKGSTTGAGRCPDGGTEDTKLSEESTKFLLEITKQADLNTEKLKACQAYIRNLLLIYNRR